MLIVAGPAIPWAGIRAMILSNQARSCLIAAKTALTAGILSSSESKLWLNDGEVGLERVEVTEDRHEALGVAG